MPAPTAQPNPDALRTMLLDQVAYLADEVEMQKRLIHRVPKAVQEGRPMPDDFSMKEIYGILALRDEQVHAPLLRNRTEPMALPQDTDLATANDWNSEPILALLNRVQQARRAVVNSLSALDTATWQQAITLGDKQMHLFALAHRITQQDADLLRDLGYRLHESRLTDRNEALPK